MLQIDQLRAILNTIEGTKYSDVQSIEKLIEYGFQLQQWMAFSGEQMSIAKETLHRTRKQAHINTIASLGSREKKYAPSLVKEYINDCCSKELGNYELAERCNRTCTHCVDLVRTCISALKEEMKMALN